MNDSDQDEDANHTPQNTGGGDLGGLPAVVLILEENFIWEKNVLVIDETWSDSTEVEFKSRNLHGYLTGSISSTFTAPEPTFQWMVEMVTVEVDTGGEDAPGQRSDAGSYSSDEDFHAAELDAKELVSIQRCSPETEDAKMSGRLMLAPNIEFYYSRLGGYRKLVSERDSKIRLHDDKVSDAMELFKAAISAPIYSVLEQVIATRDIHAMWVQLLQLCGPKSSNEGLAGLEKRWSHMEIAGDETMAVFLQRLEKLARSFTAYPVGFTKTDLHRTIIVREALKTSKLWKKLEFEIHDSERCKESWQQLQVRLIRRWSELASDASEGKGGGAEKALAAQPAVQAIVKKAREDERKKAQGADDFPGAGAKGGRTSRAVGLTCFSCGQHGHILANCPYADQIAASQKTLKAAPLKPELKSAKPPLLIKSTAAAA
ncbi:hypothetical protein B484DRAFT_407183, partial [Ochromonadaceae sp. CCMP2298]